MKQNKNWIGAVILVVVLAALMLLSDRPTKVIGGSDIIRSSTDYDKANDKASKLALAVFAKADGGEELTEKDKLDLAEAAKEFESMRAFDPRQVAANFGAGKSYMILGDLQRAKERLEQAFMNRDQDVLKNEPAVQLTATECACLLSEVLMELAGIDNGNAGSAERSGDKSGAELLKKQAKQMHVQAFEYANEAVSKRPDGPRYLAARGNALIALGRNEEAKEDIKRAFELNPAEPRVKLMAALIGLK